MRAGLIAAVAATWIAVGGIAQAMPRPVVPAAVTVSALPPTATRSVKLVRAVVAMEEGVVWAQVAAMPCEIDKVEYRWDSSKSELDASRFSNTFSEEGAKFGLKRSVQDNLFDDNSVSDGLELGVRIIDLRVYVCDGIRLRGASVMNAEWQLYDPIKREILARIRTTGGVEENLKGGHDIEFLVSQAFRENTRALFADASFRAALTPSGLPSSAPSTSRTPIALAAARPHAARPIGEVSASVVALFAGNSMGSGFLVSEDGYIITNHHVVGSTTEVRIRWSDGLETTGEVVRSDKRRDVALVKTDPRGRPPLALVRGAPAVGSAVYAVGTPLDEALQNTVTRGIVSANRFIDGFAFIQSDVGVDHGNSGGPLLDEKGRVIGITVIKIAPDDGQRGLNLFIPIGDALDFLALKTAG